MDDENVPKFPDMGNISEEEVFGKGGVREDIPDPRDYQWGRDVGSAAEPFDWNKGYNVEEEISKVLGTQFKIIVKNQNGSSSCGGQAWSYLGQVLDTLNDKATEEKSAKFIYAQTYQGVGGSSGRDNCDICIKQGWGNERDCSSYQSSLPPSEEFMQRKEDITEIARNNANSDKALAYANVLNRDIENIATAVRDNHGCIFGITGTNNGTWRSVFPVAPTTYNGSWNHWVYCGKVKVINGKKYFGILNSWGEGVGEWGWQWISEDYINTMIIGYPVVWSIWTMVAKADVVVAPTPPYVFTKILRFGSKGVDVMQLQIKLNLKVDGNFGAKTLNAVKIFQTSHGLTPDGIVGKNTNVELNKLS